MSQSGVWFRLFNRCYWGDSFQRLGAKKMTFFIAKMNQKDLVFLKSLLQAGKIVPVIDRRYPLSDAAEALRYLAEGHAQGKVVLTIPP